MVQIKTSIAFVLVAATIAPALAQPLASVSTPNKPSKAISADTTTGDAKPVGAAKPLREIIKPHGSQQPHKERFGAEAGRHKGLNREGGRHEGLNREGGRHEGFNREGGRHEGLNREGGRHEGLNREGGRHEGLNREGGRHEGLNREGGRREGLNREGGRHEGGRPNREVVHRQGSVKKQQPITDTQATPVASREYVYELDARQDGGQHHHHHHHHHGMHRQGNPTGGGPTDTPPTDAVTPSRREYTDEFFERSFDDFDLDARDFEFDLD